MTGFNKIGVAFKYSKECCRWIRKRDSKVLAEFHRTLKTKKIFREFYKKFVVAGNKLEAFNTPHGYNMLLAVRYANTIVNEHDIHTRLYDDGRIQLSTVYTDSDAHITTSIYITLFPNSSVGVVIHQFTDVGVVEYYKEKCEPQYIYAQSGKRLTAEQVSQSLNQNRLNPLINLEDAGDLMNAIRDIIEWYGSVIGAKTFKIVSYNIDSYVMEEDAYAIDGDGNKIGGDSHETKEL